MPQALRTMEKNRASLQGIWQEYFDKFDAAEATQTALQDPDRFRIVALFSAFVEHANYHAPDDPVRTRLTNRIRQALHQTEAAVIHHMKAHIELIEAYRWHQISARRQENKMMELRSGALGEDALLVQFEFLF